jgi:hypothetical protein
MTEAQGLIVVPRWVIDGLELAAERDGDARQVLLRFQRWQAHVQWNPALFGNILTQIERARAELQSVADIVRGENALKL